MYESKKEEDMLHKINEYTSFLCWTRTCRAHEAE